MIVLHPGYRLLLLLVPLLTAAGIALFVRRRRAVARALGDRDVVARIMGGDLQSVPWGRVLTVLLAALALGLAAADPRWGPPITSDEVRGGPVVLVIDVSNSMLARDAAPNRLEVAKRTAREMVTAFHGRPVGIVAFAGRAFALAPPTTDPGALDLYIEALHPEMVTQTGSSIASAVRQGIGLLLAGREKGGTIALITDGDAVDAEAAREIARLSRRAGIPVFAGGVGSTEGAGVPDIDYRTGRQVGFKRSASGGAAVSRLNEPLLREVAAASAGEYHPLGNPAALREFVARVGNAQTTGAGGGPSASLPPRYAWFAAPALLLLLVEGMLGRAGRRVRP